MTTVVISQPMFIPWIGLFNQIQMADVFVHYDDVQRPQGRSFVNRVQVSGASGATWLTAPIDRTRSGPLIAQTMLVAGQEWRRTHLATLRHLYSRQPFFNQMLDLAKEIYANPSEELTDFTVRSLEIVSDRIGLKPRFERSSDLNIDGHSTERLLKISEHYGASEYVTGHGALNYLNHQAFVSKQIDVRYMRYSTMPWLQQSHEFTPYVTVLDLVAAVGVERVAAFLLSDTRSWRDFTDEDRGVHIRQGDSS
jgi:hypothetical protein